MKVFLSVSIYRIRRLCGETRSECTKKEDPLIADERPLAARLVGVDRPPASDAKDVKRENE